MSAPARFAAWAAAFGLEHLFLPSLRGRRRRWSCWFFSSRGADERLRPGSRHGRPLLALSIFFCPVCRAEIPRAGAAFKNPVLALNAHAGILAGENRARAPRF